MNKRSRKLVVEAGFPAAFHTRAHGPVVKSKATRRMEQALYRLKKTLRKINKLLAIQKHRAENLKIRRYVKSLRTRNLSPHERLRNRDEMQYLTAILNPVTQYLGLDGKITSEQVVNVNAAEAWGRTQWIHDVSPVLKLNPPRSPVSIGQTRKNSLSCSAHVPYVSTTKPQYLMRKSKWPLIGLRDAGQDAGAMSPILWDHAAANAALVKALAKVNANDINSNEYIVEWKQVLGLLRDPLRTSLAWGKRLKRWTSRDAWIWQPQRSYRKLHDGGVLTSQLPVGGVLMSMRTKQVLDPKEASKSVVDAAVNRWLQYRYGIAPLVLDINTVFGLWLQPKPTSKNIHESARHWVSRTKIPSTSSQTRGPFTFSFKRERVTGVVYSAVVSAESIHEAPTSFRAGLHPSQWARVIWNAIPYSFVADWVIDVDKWLTARIKVPWIEIRSVCVTGKRFDKVRSTCTKVVERYYKRVGYLKGNSTAVQLYEAIERRIDLPCTVTPPWSAAWQTLKNAATSLALAINLSSLTKRPRRVT